MPAAPRPTRSTPNLDVRTLSLTQLQKLAEQGSRRARAELEGRMRAAAPGPRPSVGAQGTAPPAAPTFAQASPARAVPPMPPGPTAPANPADASDALLERLRVLAQHDDARQRADGPPRLVGMALIGWGVLLLLGGLVLLARGGGVYYAACGLASVGIGWLLMRCSIWALYLHPALALVALLWAWRGGARGSLFMALVQAAPLLIAALWLAARPVREPLE